MTSEDLARARAAWLRRELPQRLADWRRYVDDLNDHLPSETVAAMLSADHVMWENARAIAAYWTARVCRKLVGRSQFPRKNLDITASTGG